MSGDTLREYENPRMGYMIKTQVETPVYAFPKWWKSETERTEAWLVRDGDLPRVPHPYFRLRERVYATPERQFASIWRYEKACETYMEKHGIDGEMVMVQVLDTGNLANDGRKIFVAA